MNKNIVKVFAILMMCFALVSVLVACGAEGPQGPAGADGKSPYVGDNGTLWYYDDAAGKYVDSGLKVEGQKGDKGDDGEDLDDCAGHVWSEHVIVISEHKLVNEETGEATIGVTLQTCTLCGDAYWTEVDHKYVAGTPVAPTCTEDGYTVYTCECGHSYEDDKVEKLGHAYASEFNPADPDSCEGWTLAPIDAELVEGVDYCPCKYENQYTSTCVREGCGYEDIQKANAAGHHWGDEQPSVNLENKPECVWEHPWFHECKSCSCAQTEDFNCGRVENTREDGAKPHDFTDVEGVVTTAPTCTTEGVKSFACTYCGQYEKTETVPALGHDYTGVEGDITTAPTCTTEGVKSFKCNNCHEYTKTETVEALGHNKVNHDAVAATCTGNGWDAYETCSRCDYTTRGEDIPALGHTYTAASEVVLVAPTADAAGSLKFVCDVCKKAVEESNVVLPALTDENCGEGAFYTKDHKGTHCGDWVYTYTFTVEVKDEKFTKTLEVPSFSDHTEYVEGVTATRTVEGDNYIYTVYKCEKCGLWVVVHTDPKPATETPAV